MARSVSALGTMLVACLLIAGSARIQAQNQPFNPGPTDWEQINFGSDSAVIIDGMSSLQRLAALLKSNSSYRVRIIGYTDETGAAAHNQVLGQQRADSVAAYLEKYGSGKNQIATATGATSKPLAQPADTGVFTKNEFRWVNRRVELIVSDASGKPVADAMAKALPPLAPLRVDPLYTGATEIVGYAPFVSGTVTVIVNTTSTPATPVDGTGKFSIRLAKPLQIGNLVTLTSSEDPGVKLMVDVQAPPAVSAPSFDGALVEGAEVKALAETFSGMAELWVNDKMIESAAITRGSLKFKTTLKGGDVAQLRQTIGGQTALSASVVVAKKLSLAELTAKTPVAGSTKISGHTPDTSADVTVKVGADSCTAKPKADGAWECLLATPLKLGDTVEVKQTVTDGSVVQMPRPIVVKEGDFSDLSVDFIQPKENQTTVQGKLTGMPDELKQVRLELDIHNGEEHVKKVLVDAFNQDTGAFSVDVPDALAETQTIHLTVIEKATNKPVTLGQITVASSGYDWGRVKAYFSVGGVVARNDGHFGSPDPYLALNIDYNMYNRQRKYLTQAQVNRTERELVVRSSIQRVRALAARIEKLQNGQNKREDDQKKLQDDQKKPPEKEPQDDQNKRQDDQKKAQDDQKTESRAYTAFADEAELAAKRDEFRELLTGLIEQPCDARSAESTKAYGTEIQTLRKKIPRHFGETTGKDDGCRKSLWTFLVNAFFESRLTSVSTSVRTGQTSDSTTTSNGGSVESGVYVPFYTAWSQWTYRGRQNALFIAPLAKLGFVALGQGEIPADAPVNGKEVYRSFSLGARLGHFLVPRDPSSEGHELVSYLDVVAGRWDNFRLAGTESKSLYVRPWRFDVQGRFKIPFSPLFLGFEVNVGPGTDDMKFFFGTRMDIGKVLARLIPTVR